MAAAIQELGAVEARGKADVTATKAKAKADVAAANAKAKADNAEARNMLIEAVGIEQINPTRKNGHKKKRKQSEPSIESLSSRTGYKEEVVGAGGCMARSLAALKILGRTPKEVAAKLDDQIQLIHDKFNKRRKERGHLPDYDRNRVGKEGDYWHPEVVRLALIVENNKDGYVWKKCDIKPETAWVKKP